MHCVSSKSLFSEHQFLGKRDSFFEEDIFVKLDKLDEIAATQLLTI